MFILLLILSPGIALIILSTLLFTGAAIYKNMSPEEQAAYKAGTWHEYMAKQNVKKPETLLLPLPKRFNPDSDEYKARYMGNS